MGQVRIIFNWDAARVIGLGGNAANERPYMEGWRTRVKPGKTIRVYGTSDIVYEETEDGKRYLRVVPVIQQPTVMVSTKDSPKPSIQL